MSIERLDKPSIFQIQTVETFISVHTSMDEVTPSVLHRENPVIVITAMQSSLNEHSSVCNRSPSVFLEQRNPPSLEISHWRILTGSVHRNPFIL